MKVYLSWEEVLARLSLFDKPDKMIYGIPTGGMIAAGFLKQAKVTHNPLEADLLLDDLIDSGATRDIYQKRYPGIPFIGLYDKQKERINNWLIFPWEQDHPNGEDTVEQNIVRILQYLGEDVNREGLVDTPKRVVKSWDEIFCGYKAKPASLMTVFEKESYDQIVLLKDIELYSMCEHHMLPFYGKAHVAYIPDKHVIGISKLARLVDAYARRLQIQERLGDQITDALMTYLSPKGAACIIEASHMCMRMRGVGKQNSIMTTSSLRGVFIEKPAAREELFQLIKGN